MDLEPGADMSRWTIAAVVLLLFMIPATAGARPRVGTRPPLHMMATAYCLRGNTTSGSRARTGIVAADPRVMPVGSQLRIVTPNRPYSGIYTVRDTGSAVKGQTIDIFIPNCA